MLTIVNVTKKELIGIIPNRLKSDKLVLKAIQLAELAHKDDKRDNGHTYLENHIWVIAKQVITRYSNNINLKTLLISALLHDTIEDSDKFSLNDLERIFGKRIASITKKLTKDKTIKLKNKEEKFTYFKKYINNLKKSKLALIVKLEDRLANIRTIDLEDFKERESKTLFTLKTTKEVLLPLGNEVYFNLLQIELNRINKFICVS